MEEEEWREVKGFTGLYEVSNLGRVKSVHRVVYYEKSNGRTGHKTVRERVLSPKLDKDGYHEYGLSKESKVTHVRGHRLVALAFLPRVEGCDVIDHIDNVKDNNNVTNLRWVTNTQNVIEYYKGFSGNSNGLSSLSCFQWQEILKLYLDGKDYAFIVEAFDLKVKRVDVIGQVLSGRRLSSITGWTKDMRKKPNRITSDKNCLQMIEERIVGKKSLKVLANKYGFTESMVSRICSGERRPELLQEFNQTRQLNNINQN